MKTSELLTALLHGLDVATSPTLKNLMLGGGALSGDFGLRKREWDRAASKGWATGTRIGDGGWVGALTAEGRLRAIGGRDPDDCWSREWGGRWHLLLFDLAKPSPATRQRLRRWLQANAFGCLQRSVWVSPDPCPEIGSLLEGRTGHPCELIMFEAKSVDGFSDGVELAKSAWDFDAINAGYQAYIDFVKTAPARQRAGEIDLDWVLREGEVWHSAVMRDPLLPIELVPKGYMGKQAWSARRKLLPHTRGK